MLFYYFYKDFMTTGWPQCTQTIPLSVKAILWKARPKFNSNTWEASSTMQYYWVRMNTEFVKWKCTLFKQKLCKKCVNDACTCLNITVDRITEVTKIRISQVANTEKQCPHVLERVNLLLKRFLCCIIKWAKLSVVISAAENYSLTVQFFQWL